MSKGAGKGGGRRERYIQPSILMSLLKKSSYGYEIIQNLSEYGFLEGDPPPGMIYRHLRQMEEEHMVVSEWDTDESGPAKRVYTITDDGKETLAWWVRYMQRQAKRLENFVARYEEG